MRIDVAKVRDKARMLSDHVLIFLENYHERGIKNIKRINSMKLYSIGNSCW